MGQDYSALCATFPDEPTMPVLKRLRKDHYLLLRVRANKTAPIRHILFQTQHVLFNIGTDLESITDEIRELCGSWIEGPFVDTIGSMLQQMLFAAYDYDHGMSEAYGCALLANRDGEIRRVDVGFIRENPMSIPSRLGSDGVDMVMFSAFVGSVTPDVFEDKLVRALFSGAYKHLSVAHRNHIYAIVWTAWEFEKRRAAGSETTEKELADFRKLFDAAVDGEAVAAAG